MLVRNIAAGALLVAGSACYLLGVFAYVSELLRLVATFIPASTPLWATALAWLLVVPAAAPLGWAPMLLLGWWAEVALPAGLGLLGWGLTRAAAAAAGPGADEAEAVRAQLGRRRRGLRPAAGRRTRDSA